MLTSQRIIFDDNGTETDYSVILNDYRSSTATIPFVVSEDYLYIASDLPFNHRFFLVETANDQSADISVDIWYSREWVPAVDIIDQTSSGGKSLAQSGVIRWTTDRNKGWDQEQDSEDVTGVDAIGLYDMYWARLSWDSSLKNTTALQYVGHKFATDSILTDHYPDLANTALMDAFETGKTDWNDQHYMAADKIIRDLKKRNIILSQSQILDFEKFEDPSVHKVAEIIYKGLGRSYEDDRKSARKYYEMSMNMNFYNIDKDKNARLTDRERRISTGWFSR